MLGTVDINALKREAQNVRNQCERRLQDLGLLYEHFEEAIRIDAGTYELLHLQRTKLLCEVQKVNQELDKLVVDGSMQDTVVKELQEYVENLEVFLESDRKFHPLKLVQPADLLYKRIPHFPADTHAERSVLDEVTDLIAWLVRLAEQSVGIRTPLDARWDIPARIDWLKQHALRKGNVEMKTEVHIGNTDGNVVVGSKVGGNVTSVKGNGNVVHETITKQRKAMSDEVQLSKHQLTYSIGGQCLGLACIFGGIVLFLNGVIGSTSLDSHVSFLS